jgi:hypothetical protein
MKFEGLTSVSGTIHFFCFHESHEVETALAGFPGRLAFELGRAAWTSG